MLYDNAKKSNKKKKWIVSLPTAIILSTVILSIILLVINQPKAILRKDIVKTNTFLPEPNTEQHQLRQRQETKDNPSKCLSFHDTLKEKIEAASQIFIVSPCKAGSTSMVQFTSQCLNVPILFYEISGKDNFPTLSRSFDQLSPIITDRIYYDKPLMRLIKGSTDSSLIIYSHRQENDRLMASIRQVAWHQCYNKKFENTTMYNVHRHKNHYCVIEEEGLIRMIEREQGEIGSKTQKIWKCDTFDAIKDFQPNVVVMNYKQVNNLQSALASKYCPDMIEKIPIHARNQGNFKAKMYVKMKSLTKDGRNITRTLDDWMERKKDLIEWSMDSYEDASCRGKMRQIENSLFNCEDGLMELSSIKDNL